MLSPLTLLRRSPTPEFWRPCPLVTYVITIIVATALKVVASAARLLIVSVSCLSAHKGWVTHVPGAG